MQKTEQAPKFQEPTYSASGPAGTITVSMGPGTYGPIHLPVEVASLLREGLHSRQRTDPDNLPPADAAMVISGFLAILGMRADEYVEE